MPIKIFSPGLVLHHRVVGVGVQGCGEGKQGRRARGCIIPVSSFCFLMNLIAVYRCRCPTPPLLLSPTFATQGLQFVPKGTGIGPGPRCILHRGAFHGRAVLVRVSHQT